MNAYTFNSVKPADGDKTCARYATTMR
jgi:hypothetical protein